MTKIKALAPEEIKKIAAGQVVERPATVVKELVENSLDAGATEITLFLRDGGNTFIRVIDNGSGMSPADSTMACAAHATSKITHIDDLQTLTTYGFRGEALASIAAVSNFTLVTREQTNTLGTKLILNYGTVVQEQEVSCQTGTDISIAELFDNVPARKKFLKATETELRVINTLMQSFIIAHQQVHFKIFHNDILINNCPPVTDINTRFIQLWDHYCAQQLLSFDFSDKLINLAGSGVVSRMQYLRHNSAQIFLFINKRRIKNIGLMRSILKGYSGALPQGRYPIAALFIETDPALIDVNIHPRKEEIKFVHEHKIEQLVQQAVKTCLAHTLSQQLSTEQTTFDRPHINFMQAQTNPISHNSENITAWSNTHQNNISPEPVFTPGRIINEDELFPAPHTNQIPATQIRSYRFIGQCYHTYLVLEKDDELIFIDQHAAHERILYERIINTREPVQPIALLFPHTISLAPKALTLLTKNTSLLTQHGIIGDCMGSDRFVIKQVPVYLKHINLTELIHDIVRFLQDSENQDDKFIEHFNNSICTQMACKAAVKAGDELSIEKIYEILDQLETVDNRTTCPHGRPTVWSLGKSELEKKFRRDYTK